MKAQWEMAEQSLETDSLVETRSATAFTIIVVTLGLLTLAVVAFTWRLSDPARYAGYLMVAIACSVVGRKLNLGKDSTMLSVVFVVLGIVELNNVETITLGCTPALVQCLLDQKFWKKPAYTMVSIGSLAAAIVTARFAHDSLVPSAVSSVHVRLIVGCVAFFVMNTFPRAVVIGLGQKKRLSKVWKESFFWLFPYYVVGAAASGMIRMAGPENWEVSILMLPVIFLVYRSYHSQVLQVEERRKHFEDSARLYNGMIEGLAIAAEARSRDTRRHLMRVQFYAVEVAAVMKMPQDQLNSLRSGAILHDIGKIAVPKHILSKPARLSVEEFNQMKSHAVAGASLLKEMEFPEPVVKIVRHHHERWDGTGYPDGLSEEQIPAGARILAAVDCFDALTSDREYRKALPLEQAVRVVEQESGKSYDPRVVKILSERYKDLYRRAHESLGDEESRPEPPDQSNQSSPMAGYQEDAWAKEGAVVVGAPRESHVLFELSQELSTSPRLEQMLPVISTRIAQLVPFDAIGVFVLDAGVLQAVYATGIGAPVLGTLRVPTGEGLIGWVAAEGKPLLNGNPQVDPGLPRREEESLPLQSALAVPLEWGPKILGVLVVYRREAAAFTVKELSIVRTLCVLSGQAIENALGHRSAEDAPPANALKPPLPNMRAFLERLNTELRRCEKEADHLAVLTCDLDGFRKVNQRWGTQDGNRFLQEIADGFNALCRERDVAVRIGDDEFVMLVQGLKQEELTGQIARLSEVVSEAHRKLFHEEGPTISVGAAFFPENGPVAGHLLAVANSSMHRAKRNLNAPREAANRL